jgi:hypothetical protein
MAAPSFARGDRVVDLAFLFRSSAVLTGAVAAAISVWMLRPTLVGLLAAALLGGAGGFLLGSVVGRAVFPAARGRITVVKLGPGAWPLALKAGWLGGTTAGILAAVLTASAMGGTSALPQLLAAGALAGIVVGAVFAYLVTR